ncbi:MAG: 16S rRNA (guanine(966)-N(2))-methyltransferase RsmD [Desulfobacterium sp.]|nr:16S rRNA (guanine(966)-N(2))-methyltransferase RsmD [Desulfobacterium sp.]
MRIISGTCKGRKLVTPRGLDTRPTSDRVRESVFNIISREVEGARVLDLFAGTGALGMEALSRNAASALFVDKSQDACAIIKENISLCRLEDPATVLCHDITQQVLPAWAVQQKFDLVFMDPPYDRGLIDTVLGSGAFIGLLADHALIIAEQSARENPIQSTSILDIRDQRKYGKTRISFLTLNLSCERD